MIQVRAARLLAVVALVVALVSAVVYHRTGAASSGDSPGPGSDELIIRLPVQPVSLNPTTYRMSYDSWMLEYLMSPLYMLDKKSGEMVPELAVALPERSADGLEWTIRLRKDARWHDGPPVTARDFKTSFDLLKNPKVDAARLRSTFSKLTALEVVDSHTLRLRFSEPFWYALYALADFPLVPDHVAGKIATPEEWNKVDRVPGCGPYRLQSWKRGDRLVLVRNEDWFGEKPNLKRITYRYIPDDQTALGLLARGEIDATPISPEIWSRQVSRDERLKAKTQLIKYYRPRYFYIGWNLDNPMFAERKTRQALTMLLDMNALIEQLFAGEAKPVTGPFYFRSAQNDPDVKPLPYDPVKAVELLAEAGWRDSDNDGTLDRDGRDFSFKYPVSPGVPLAENLAAFVKDSFKLAGIRVEIETLEHAVRVDRLKRRQFTCCALAWSWATPDHDPYQIWHSSAAEDGGMNHVGFRNAEVDELIEEARTEFDPRKRNELYHRLQRLIYEEQPYIFLVNPRSMLLVDKRFRGLQEEEYATGIVPRIAFEWWVPPGEEKRAK